MILVTGGTGLLGAHLLFRLAKRGEKIRASFRSESRKSLVLKIFNYYSAQADSLYEQIEWVQCDLMDTLEVEAAFEGIHTVFHCAALVSFHPKDRKSLLKINPTTTANVVNQALASKIEQLIYVSSVAALGRETTDGIYDENTQWKDSPENSAYSESKRMAELEVWRGMEEGLSASIINPVVLFGPGPWKEGSMAIFDLVEKGFPFYPPGTNGFVDVRDVVEAMLRMADQKRNGERYVAVSESLPFKTVLDHIARGYGRALPTKAVKEWMLTILAFVHRMREFFGGAKATITKETVGSSLRTSLYRNDKIKRDLQMEFRPMAQSIQEITAYRVQEADFS